MIPPQGISLTTPHPPSKQSSHPISLFQRTPPGLASLCCNKYMFSSSYCEIFGWGKVILVIAQIFEARIFFLSSPKQTCIIHFSKFPKFLKQSAHPPLRALCLANAPYASKIASNIEVKSVSLRLACKSLQSLL